MIEEISGELGVNLMGLFTDIAIPIGELSEPQMIMLGLIWKRLSSDPMNAVKEMHAYLESGRSDVAIIEDLQRHYEYIGPRVGTQWQHINGDALVEIVGNGIDEATFQHMVIYHHQESPVIWLRPWHIFKTRFKHVESMGRLAVMPSVINDPVRPLMYDIKEELRQMDRQPQALVAAREAIMDVQWYQNKIKELLNKLEGL